MNHSITMLFDFTRVSLAQLLRKIAHLARGSACCVLESRTAEDLKIGKRGRPSRTTCSVNWTWRRIFPPSWGWSWGAQPLFWSTCGQLCSVKTGWLFHGFPSGDRGTWQMIHCICSGCFWIQSDLRIEVGMSCWSHKLKAGCAACSCSGLSGWCLKRVGMFPLLGYAIVLSCSERLAHALQALQGRRRSTGSVSQQLRRTFRVEVPGDCVAWFFAGSGVLWCIQWIEGNSFTINQGVFAKRERGFRFQFSGTNPLMEQHAMVMGLGIALESWLWLVAMMLWCERYFKCLQPAP